MQGLLPPPPAADMLNLDYPGRTRVHGSSYASTEHPDQRYPMDEIQHQTSRELHIAVMNLTTRVAYGMALPPKPDQKHHGEEIPKGTQNTPPKKAPSGAPPPQKSPSQVYTRSTKNATPKKAPSGAAPRSTAQSLSQRKSQQKSNFSVKTTQEKHAYDKNQEELDAHVQEECDRIIFRKTSPLKKTPVDQAAAAFFVRMSQRGKTKHVTDFERTLRKTCAQKRRKKNDEVIQHGQQGTLHLPQEDVVRAAKQAGVTVAQWLGEEEILTAEEVWKFAPRKPLVNPDLVKYLPTQMRRFHVWYMNKSATDPDYLITVHVKDDYYFNGIDMLYLDFKDIYEIYHQGTLDIALVSCWVLMEIQLCRNEGIHDVGFMVPVAINQKTILSHREDVKGWVVKILLIIQMKNGVTNVLDSMRKPTSDYKEVMDVLEDAWGELSKIQPGHREELTLKLDFLCYRQSQGTNVCGYYVCDFMHTHVAQRDMSMLQMSNILLPEDKIKVAQEALMGFINDQIIHETGEFYDTGEELPPPPDYVPRD
ncbi:hypothetical protein BS78_03G139300 [Paspalum vaginatum]|nr:hypothetical protein BS78_03G139300 [Paspalum vaginatum]